MVDFIIKDFQSIEKASIRVKGFTLIVGESSAGKSACMRALQAATSNRFKSGQVRYGQDNATVSIRFAEDGDILRVTRPYNGSISMALKSKGNVIPFNKLGRTVPSEVNDFLNLGSLSVADDSYSLSFHDQFQKPILLEYSQKKVMDILSASKGLDELNDVREYTLKRRTELRGAFKAVSSVVDQSKVNLSESKELVDKIKPIYELYDTLFSEFRELSESLNLLELCSGLLKEVNVIKSKCDIQEKIFTTLSSVKELVSEHQSLIECQSRLRELALIKSSISVESKLFSVLGNHVVTNDTLKSLELVKSLIVSTAKIGLTLGKVDSRYSILKSIQFANTMVSRHSATLSQLNNIATCLQFITSLDERINELSDVIEHHLCPVCHSQL